MTGVESNLEASPLEYARFSGIAVNHLTEPLPLNDIALLQQIVTPCLIENKHLYVPAPLDDSELSEPPILSKGGAFLFRELGSRPHTDIIKLLGPFTRSWPLTKRHLDLPLLRTDHTDDLVSFARRAEPTIESIKLPREPLDEAGGQGMSWPSESLRLPDRYMSEAANERLVMSKDILLKLCTMDGKNGKDTEQAVWDELQQYKKRRSTRPLTPPLLPVSPPLTPYIPSSPACHLETLSDPVSLLSADIRAVENVIFDDDGIVLPNEPSSEPSSEISGRLSALGDIYSPLACLRQSPCTPKITRIKPGDRKVEVPITPTLPSAVAPEVFELDAFMKDTALYPNIYEKTGCGFDGSDLGLEFLCSTQSQKTLQDVNQMTEQESLDAGNSLQRVNVPFMDFSKPQPPWVLKLGTPSILAVQNEVCTITKSQLLPERCSGARTNDPTLRWNPYTSRSPVLSTLLYEILDTDATLEKWLGLNKLTSPIGSSNLIWKPSGLRILRTAEDQDGDDDIELLPGTFLSKDKTISQLVKKRKFAEDIVIPIAMKPSKQVITQSAGTSRPIIDSGAGNDTFKIFSSSFSPTQALYSFLERRGERPAGALLTQSLAPKTGLDISSIEATSLAPVATQATDLKNIRNAIPIPRTKTLTSCAVIFVSSALFQRRHVLSTIRALCPGIKIIERDYKAHDRVIWAKGSVTRTSVTSPLGQEADLTLSPGVGVLLTSMQQVKQKSLPGSKSLSSLRTRIVAVGKRYEQLIVLVNTLNEDDLVQPFDTEDCRAFTELVAFAESLRAETDVSIKYVPGTNESIGRFLAFLIAETATSLAALLQEHFPHTGPPSSMESLILRSEETHWELFLRRAGLNSFAAQMLVLGVDELRANREQTGQEESAKLKALTHMERSERMRVFSGLLGGSRVLKRVSGILDQQW